MSVKEHLTSAVASVEDAIRAALDGGDAGRFLTVGRLVELGSALHQEANPRVRAYVDSDDEEPREPGYRRGRFVANGFIAAAENPRMPRDMDPQVRELMMILGPMLNAHNDAQARGYAAQELVSLLQARDLAPDPTVIDARIAELQAGLNKPTAPALPDEQRAP